MECVIETRALTILEFIHGCRRIRLPGLEGEASRLKPGIGEPCWESLPPTLCGEALGGHLARQ
jgi:hypothetical protein